MDRPAQQAEPRTVRRGGLPADVAEELTAVVASRLRANRVQPDGTYEGDPEAPDHALWDNAGRDELLGALWDAGLLARASRPAVMVHLFAPPEGAPAELGAALNGWAHANGLDPSRVFDGVAVNLADRVIRCKVLAEPDELGAYNVGGDGVCRRDVEVPLLVPPPAELRRPPMGYTYPVTGAKTWFDWGRYRHTCDPDRPLDGLGDLALFLGGDETSFIGELLKLLVKAQSSRERFTALEAAFPREVFAWQVWMGLSPTPTAAELCTALCTINGMQVLR